MGWWVSVRFLKEWEILKYLSLLKVCHEAQEAELPHTEMKMCEGQYTSYLFSARWSLRLDMLETQIWMSIIFNHFPSCIISLSIEKLIGKGLYCKSLFKPICLHFYKSEIFCKRMVLSKTSTSDWVLELDLLGRYNKSPEIFAIVQPQALSNCCKFWKAQTAGPWLLP